MTGAVRATGRWPILRAPLPFVSYLLVVDAAALLACTASVLVSGAVQWATIVVLACIAVGFEEFVHRAARLRIRLGPQMRVDMVSVWGVAAAVALRPSTALILLGVIFTHTWFREWRPAGDALYRKLFVVSTALLACLGAGSAFRAVARALDSHPVAALPCSIIVAILATTAINRGLVSVALLITGARVRDLVGTRDDNLIELATLSLGGLLGVAVAQQPWIAVLVVAPMITLQRGALMHTLETAATVDAKTGLLNAIAWEQIASAELARAQREKTITAVLLIDLDRFKVVNDEHGHLAGDSVLRGIGTCIESCVREYDTVGRFGGEEFVGVLPDIDEAGALLVADRIRARVNELAVSSFVDEVSGGPLLSVSIGVACAPAYGNEVSELLRAADAALYRAKAAGRNRVVLAERGTGPSQAYAV